MKVVFFFLLLLSKPANFDHLVKISRWFSRNKHRLRSANVYSAVFTPVFNAYPLHFRSEPEKMLKMLLQGGQVSGRSLECAQFAKN
jgi:hypothetical protein